MRLVVNRERATTQSKLIILPKRKRSPDFKEKENNLKGTGNREENGEACEPDDRRPGLLLFKE